MKFKFSKFDFGAIVFLLIINYLLKIPLTSKGFFAFTYDQGRDLLAVSKIIYQGDLVLIGPTTGLPGIFYGPWWYYFLALVLYLTGGDPQKVAIFFSLVGIFTVIAIFLLIKYLTNNSCVALTLAIVSSMSALYLFSPIAIWSPTLVPILMTILVAVVYKIFKNPSPFYFFLLGLITLAIADFGAAFGILMTLFLILSPLIFRKAFFRKEFLLTILGGILVLSPRILFEIRNDFLISKSIFAYFDQPKVYGDQIPIIGRFLERLDLFWGIFSSSLARNNKLVGLLMTIFLVLVLLILARHRTYRQKLKGDSIFSYTLALLLVMLVGFTIYPDTVWDYYLVGLPIIFAVIIARVLMYALKIEKLKFAVKLFLVILVVLNFNKALLEPSKITWPGEGATYRNQKMVIDYIASQNPQNYGFYAYSPAIFDYAFDYLVDWYTRLGLIEKPKENQKVFYLVIRDDPSHTYLLRGWYGDKTKDQTTILERKEFPGNLIVEKHFKNEKK